MRRSLIRTGAAGAVLVLALGACGSTGREASKVSTLAMVAGAPQAAADAKTAHMSGSMRVAAAGERMEIPIEGDIDFANGAAQISMDMSTIGAASGMKRASGGGTLEMRMVDGVMYMNMGAMIGSRSGSVFGGRSWIKVDLKDVGAGSTGLAGQNPSDYLDTLRGAADVTELGTARINGVDTTHFRAQIDMAKSLGKMTPKLRALAAKGLAAFGKHFPVDVWISNDGLPRRFALHLDMKGVASVSAQIDYTDYGASVSIKAPPADETMDSDAFKSLQRSN